MQKTMVQSNKWPQCELSMLCRISMVNVREKEKVWQREKTAKKLCMLAWLSVFLYGPFGGLLLIKLLLHDAPYWLDLSQGPARSRHSIDTASYILRHSSHQSPSALRHQLGCPRLGWRTTVRRTKSGNVGLSSLHLYTHFTVRGVGANFMWLLRKTVEGIWVWILGGPGESARDSWCLPRAPAIPGSVCSAFCHPAHPPYASICLSAPHLSASVCCSVCLWLPSPLPLIFCNTAVLQQRLSQNIVGLMGTSLFLIDSG